VKRRWKLWIVLVLVLLVLGASAVLLATKVPVLAYSRIKLGMTLVEVEAAIGMPAGDYSSTPNLRPRMGPFGNHINESGIPSTCLPDAAGNAKEGYVKPLTVKRWTWDDYWIWVAFNEDGKTVGYYLLEVICGPSWFEGLLKRLGL
jgi:hypothetical protein